MKAQSATTGQRSGGFAEDVRADVLLEKMLLPKQVLVIAAIGLLLLLRQLVLT